MEVRMLIRLNSRVVVIVAQVPLSWQSLTIRNYPMGTVTLGEDK